MTPGLSDDQIEHIIENCSENGLPTVELLKMMRARIQGEVQERVKLAQDANKAIAELRGEGAVEAAPADEPGVGPTEIVQQP